MANRKIEADMPRDMVLRLAFAAQDEVLVGGQALAVWVQRFELVVPPHIRSISADIDFLARSAAAQNRVSDFARVLGGQTFFPNKRALTALVGQAYLDISDEAFLNVDVIHRVLGIEAGAVRERAVRFEVEGGAFQVMHPLHVLLSRLTNLYKLAEKQTEKGLMQLMLAIDVGREHLRAEARGARQEDIGTGRSPIQDIVSEIERMALSDAGRKVARRYGVHVADAIDPGLIPAGPFWAKRWPQIRPLMSAEYALRFNPPSDPTADGP
jgi:hypothetical protein